MLCLASMMIPGTVILIPLFKIVQALKLIDTYAGLILPFVFTGYGTFMMRQFFRGLPRELYAAARVDGAGYWTIYTQIYLPLAKPALATLGTLAFVFFWNSLLWPLVATNSDVMKTVPVGMSGLVAQNSGYPHLIMAGATITVLPGLVLFLLMQRYYTQGFVMSGVKG
jgi:multiple sugar transport system permease protein